jgi:type I restriction enzyme, S subunit
MKYRLGDICTITKGETGIMKAIPGAYTMVALGEANKTHNEYQFDAKAVIIPLVSSTGHGHASMKRVKYQEGKFALGNILCAVIPKNENFVLAKYLHIYLHWNREELLVSQMKGMANVSLPMNRIADVEVIVPSIEKQRQIVKLEAKLVEKELEADKLFADQLTQLENLNQAILQEAVQGKLVPQNPTDEPASELFKRIKAEKNSIGLKPSKGDGSLNSPAFKGRANKELPPIKPEEIPFEIPENWVWCRLGWISTFIDYRGKTPNKVNSGIKLITAKNVKKGWFSNLPEEFISDKDYLKHMTRGIPSNGDILFTTEAPLANACILEYQDLFALAQRIITIQPVLTINKYLLSTILSNQIQKLIIGKQSGITAKGIKSSKLIEVLIPLPPLSEQTRIVAEIEKQLAKTKQLKEHILANQQATKQLLKALLHDAFEVENV